MNRTAVTLLALVLLLTPIFVAVPDAPDELLWSSWLCVAVLTAVLFALGLPWRKKKAPSPFASQGPFPKGKGRQKAASPKHSRPEDTTTAIADPLPLWGGLARSAGVDAFLVLLGLALCSLVARLIVQHSTAYLGLMLRGWGVLAVDFALFVLCRRVAAQSRTVLYGLILTGVFASAIVAAWGTGEYLLQSLAGIHNARIFSTSTPDFLAGYLVLLLPITLALFLGIPRTVHTQAFVSGALLRLLFGLVVLMQAGVLLMTQSRFSLVSLTVAAVVFLMAARAIRGEETRTPLTTKPGRLGAMLCILLVCTLFAKPVIGRFSHLQDNSTAFRLWTWRGAGRMAAANPVLGTGIGAWVDLYPRYALTGFTRLAHNGYLQMADECGFPALLVLLTTLGLVGRTGVSGLMQTPSASDLPTNNTLSAIAPADDRLLLAGMLAGLAASAVQNLVDSDWYVFFLGVTFWAVTGLSVGLAQRGAAAPTTAPKERPLLVTIGGLAVLGLALFGVQGVAALFGRLALTDDTPAAAAQDALTAHAWDPLNARYPADLGWRIYARTGRPADAELPLRQAAALEPNGTNFRRLGTVLDQQGRKTEADAVYQAGLRVDPNSLDLRLALAQDSPPAKALELYRQVAALEDSPVGRVRAIGEVTEVRFAIADAALGQAAADAGNTADADRFDARAQRLLEAYADQGGTTNPEQQALIGGHPSPDQDARMRDLYERVMDALARRLPPDQQATLETHRGIYRQKFDRLLLPAQ